MQHQCLTAGCTGRLRADGAELGVFRFSEKLAFGYELLYNWADCVTARGDTWFGWWRDTLLR